jgi:hypothetical protein
MSIAEIHGKISSSGSNLSDRLEDMLTSDIFGPLRYLPFQDGLLNILLQARNYSNDTWLSLDIGDKNPILKIHFWPKLSNSEPDILIEFGDQLFIIEVKYLSGKSGHFDSNEAEQGNLESASSDQLGREFIDLLNFPGKFQRRSLIYLTSHRELPMHDIKAGHDAVIVYNPKDYGAQYQDNTYWLSWFTVHELISNLLDQQQSYYQKLILKDMKCLLHKKGFRGFEGFANLDIKNVKLQFDTIFYKKRLSMYFKNVNSPVNAVSGKIFYQGEL